MNNPPNGAPTDLPLLKGVIFDLDGTLSESAPAIARALAATWRDLGRAEPTLEATRAMIGDGPALLIQRARVAAGLQDDPDAVKSETRQFLDNYALEGPGGDPFPGALEVLATLAGMGLKLSVCTNKPQIAAERLLDGLGFSQYLEGVVGGDAVPAQKPDPAHANAAVALLGDIPVDAAMLVGDGPQDIASGEAAGLQVIVAAYGYGGVAEARPDLPVISDIGVLPALLQRIRVLPS
jgi:phosphoglycolate phosphatase